MKQWYQENRKHPYPTTDYLIELIIKTGLETKTINRWLANQRRKEKEWNNNEKPYKCFSDNEKAGMIQYMNRKKKLDANDIEYLAKRLKKDKKKFKNGITDKHTKKQINK